MIHFCDEKVLDGLMNRTFYAMINIKNPVLIPATIPAVRGKAAAENERNRR